MNRKTLAMGVAVATAFAAQAASAATTTEVFFQNATGVCQPTLPVFEGNIRKRPVIVANEGTSNAFVACSLETDPNGTRPFTDVDVVIYNQTAADVDVTCSLVHNFTTGGPVIPQTLTVPASDRAFFSFSAADAGVTELSFANFNCNLPPGTGIGYMYYFYEVEIGA
jgi:hypothetical protein